MLDGCFPRKNQQQITCTLYNLQPATQPLDDSIKMDETLQEEEEAWDQMNSIQCTFWKNCTNKAMKLYKNKVISIKNFNIDNYNMISLLSREVFSQLFDEAKVDVMSSDGELTEIATRNC